MNLHRLTRIAAAIAALAPALPATATDEAPALPAQATKAAEPTKSAQPVQRVIITGSNIKRIDIETSDPVVILRREDVERSGAATVAQYLQSLPWTTESLDDRNSATGFASGGSNTSLRHLGAQSTLVLLNGRRVAPFALANFSEYFTNLDTLPLAAIDRIEILKNGASAIYGSDAVAGVINVITRQDYQGFEAGVDVQQSLNSHSFGEHGFRAAAGVGDLKTDRFNLTGSLQYYHRDRVIWRDVLDHTSAQWRNSIRQGWDQFSPYSTPGNISSDSHPSHPVAGCDPNLTNGGVCWYDRYKGLEAQPAADRASLLVTARAALAPDVEGFAEFLWALTKTSYRYPNPAYGSTDSATLWADPNTGAPQSFYSFRLPPTHPLNDTGENAALLYRFGDADPMQNTGSHNYRLVTGVRGSAGGYDWETSLAFLGSTTSQLLHGFAISRSGFARTIGGSTDTSDPASPIDPNFFNLPGGYRIGQQNDRAVLDTLFPQVGSRAKLTQTALDGKISGEIADLPAGPLGFATGYDLRHERSVIMPTENVLAGDMVGYGASRTDGARTYGAVFGELNIPVVKSLDAQVAARLDKFPGFDAHVSPKLGLRFQPSKELLLRGTAEGGFRAPNLTEAAPTRKVAFESMRDPRRCGPAEQYAADLQAQADALPDNDPQAASLRERAGRVRDNECNVGLTSVITNNPALKPEESRGYSFGLLFEPLQDTSFALDYWKLDRKNEIGTRSTDELLQQEGALPPGVAVHRAPLSADPTFNSAELQQKYGVTVGALQGVDNQFVNVSRTRTDGVDFSAKTRIGTPVGKLDLNLIGTFLNRFQAYSAARGDYGDNLAGRYGYSRWSANLSGALTTGAFVNGLTLNYASGTSLQRDYSDTLWSPQGCADQQVAARDCRVAAYVRTDYFFAYNGIRNLTLSAHIGNLFNRAMPFDRKAADGFLPPVEDVQRRTLRVALNYKFL